jgi:membrane-associated phospholipid phosphatase
MREGRNLPALLHEMDWVLPLRSPVATLLANLFTWFGYTPFFLIFLPVGYWLGGRALFTRLTVLVALTALANAWFKDFWLVPRPDLAYALDPRVGETYGMPSGHAQVAAAMWFWLAYESRRGWAFVAAAAITFAVSFSRVYLGVHDVSQVLVGVGLGLGGLVVYAWIVGPAARFWQMLPEGARLAAIAAGVPLLWLIWPNGQRPDQAAAVLLLLAGWWAGVMFDRRVNPPASIPRIWWYQAAAMALGIAVLFALRVSTVALGAALHLDPRGTGWASALILGFYATGIAPAGFLAIGLRRQDAVPDA